MAKFHFVEDYENLVKRLIEECPIDEAMERAVGGDYEETGRLEADILKHAGLRSRMSVFDLGCGSGRLASALGRSGLDLEYLGTDIVQPLIDYARSKTPRHYRFNLHRELSVPADDSSIDIACAFSVFTHLLHHETYIYLEDMFRVLKPGGRAVFSFLEFAAHTHWTVFSGTVSDQKKGPVGHLNTFIERSVIEIWSRHLGFQVEGYIDGQESVAHNKPLGQSVAILRRPLQAA